MTRTASHIPLNRAAPRPTNLCVRFSALTISLNAIQVVFRGGCEGGLGRVSGSVFTVRFWRWETSFACFVFFRLNPLFFGGGGETDGDGVKFTKLGGC